MGLLEQVYAIAPEMVLTAGIVVLLFADFLISNKKKYILSIIAFLFYAGALIVLINSTMTGNTYLFSNQIHIDGMGNFFRCILILTGLITIIYSYNNPEMKEIMAGEFQVLLMGTILGGIWMGISSNMVMIYLALEFVSILSYIMTGIRVRNAKASEGAIKYVLFGAVSSGIMLFGLSYLYGLSGSLELSKLGVYFQQAQLEGKIFFILMLVLVFGGISYKLAVIPFHSWCPDVYEGAATPITTFFSVGPKIAGFALLIRFFNEIFPVNISQPQLSNIFFIIAIVSAITMSIGNLAALWQNNIKRLLAYSSIAHAGYILAGIPAYSQIGNHAILYYLMVYLIMNVGAFLVAMVVGGDEDLNAFDGLAYKSSKGAFWASIMTIYLFSLIGLPPLAGFFGKFYIFSALIDKNLYWLVIVGIINTVISLYYYARILKAMFFNTPNSEQQMFSPIHYQVLGVVLMILTVLFGIYPQMILSMWNN